MSFHSAVSRAIWRTHQKQTRPPTTDSSIARERLFEIAPKCMFDLLDLVVRLLHRQRQPFRAISRTSRRRSHGWSAGAQASHASLKWHLLLLHRLLDWFGSGSGSQHHWWRCGVLKWGATKTTRCVHHNRMDSRRRRASGHPAGGTSPHQTNLGSVHGVMRFPKAHEQT